MCRFFFGWGAKFQDIFAHAKCYFLLSVFFPPMFSFQSMSFHFSTCSPDCCIFSRSLHPFCAYSFQRVLSHACLASCFVRFPDRTSLEAYIDFKFRLSKSRTSLQAYIDFNFHISLSKTSVQAYFGFKFDLSHSTASLGAYVALNSTFQSQELV
jgi:hypothetical protein